MNAEAIAVRNLTQQDMEVFTPFKEVTCQRGSKLIQNCIALFPGYLFAKFDPDRVRWRTVNSTLGVSRLVSFAEDRPAQVPVGLISILMDRCDPSGKLLPPQFLDGGDVVCVASGPFTKFIGTVEKIATNQRIWVLLNILGKNTRVEIKSANLKLVKC